MDPETPCRPGLIPCRKVEQQSFPRFFFSISGTLLTQIKNIMIGENPTEDPRYSETP